MDFLQQLSQVYDDLDYEEFLKRTDLVDSTYALEKFKTFQQGCRALLAFDANTLGRVLSGNLS